MPTATQVLDVARSQLGQSEDPRGSNRTKYGAWFGVNPAPWCSMFVCWVLNTAGGGALVAGARTAKGAAYSGDVFDHFRRQGRVSPTPQVGDLVVWDWPGAGTNSDHIGFVETLNAASGRVGTIEGNSPGSGFTYDVVGRHTRDRARSVRGYCHPAYAVSGAGSPSPTPPASPLEEEDMTGALITTDDGKPGTDRTWWHFDGQHRRPVGPGEPQTLVDLKLVAPGPDGRPVVKPVAKEYLAAIPVAAGY